MSDKQAYTDLIEHVENWLFTIVMDVGIDFYWFL